MLPEKWLPHDGLSQVDCIRAAMTMAEFCVLESQTPTKTSEELFELLGSFTYASWLSCETDELTFAIRDYTMRAGIEEPYASRTAIMLSDSVYLDAIVRGDFIREHNVAMGLWKREKIQVVNHPKFVRAILKMSPF